MRRTKYRSRIDIVSHILEAAKGGDTKTKIMYKTFLSYPQLKEYLTILTANDLLSYDLVKQTYKTTEKGFGFIELYNRLGGMINGEEQHQQQLQLHL